MTDFVFMACWGALVLSAYVGWGRVVARAAGAPDPDWGLAAGWGMAALIAAGGVLAVLGLARPPVLVALVAGGVGIHAAGLWKRGLGGLGGPGGRSRWAWAVAAAVAVVLAARYATVVSYVSPTCADEAAYFTYVARLLQTGTLIEPFGVRRLGVYGGHAFLQAMVVMAGSEDNGFLLDRGLAVVVAFGLVLGFFRSAGGAGPLASATALLMALFLPFPLANSSSHLTGFALFLVLARTLDAGTPDGGGSPARRLWLVGLTVAGAGALKATFLAAAAVAVFAWWLMGASGDGARRRRPGVSLGHLAVSTLVFLVPWMVLLERSSGTPLFPLFPGNHDPVYAEIMTRGALTAERVAALGRYFAHPVVAAMLAPLVLHAFRRGGRPGLALYAGAVAVALATVWVLATEPVLGVHRYVAPVLNAAFAATVATFVGNVARDRSGREGKFRIGDGILCAAVLMAAPASVYRDAGHLVEWFGETVLTPDRRLAYRQMQDAVPPGARVLAIVDAPFALDYRRNAIFNIDLPGGASPPPGMPYFRGAGAVKDYLLGQSIRFVAFQDFDRLDGCLYSRDAWAGWAGANPPAQRHARYFLDLMDNIDRLARSGRVLHRSDGLGVIALD